MKKIVIVGLGLIGGSIAKALKRNTENLILGIDTDEDVLLDACSAEAIDGKADIEDIKSADIVYLCVYPKGAVEFVKKYGPLLKENCILTDACGVKQELCAAIEKEKANGKYVFVGGHPMAGKENCGFSESDPSIFVGASYIIVSCGAPEWAVKEVEELVTKMGFGRIMYATPEKHDEMIAFTSQTPHVIACSYVMSPRCKGHKGFSAGSYRDVSRVASINEVLWSRLFLDNGETLVAEIDELIRNMKNIRDAIESRDEEQLKVLLRAAAQVKKEEG